MTKRIAHLPGSAHHMGVGDHMTSAIPGETGPLVLRSHLRRLGTGYICRTDPLNPAGPRSRAQLSRALPPRVTSWRKSLGDVAEQRAVDRRLVVQPHRRRAGRRTPIAARENCWRTRATPGDITQRGIRSLSTRPVRSAPSGAAYTPLGNQNKGLLSLVAHMRSVGAGFKDMRRQAEKLLLSALARNDD